MKCHLNKPEIGIQFLQEKTEKAFQAQKKQAFFILGAEETSNDISLFCNERFVMY